MRLSSHLHYKMNTTVCTCPVLPVNTASDRNELLTSALEGAAVTLGAIGTLVLAFSILIRRMRHFQNPLTLWSRSFLANPQDQHNSSSTTNTQATAPQDVHPHTEPTSVSDIYPATPSEPPRIIVPPRRGSVVRGGKFRLRGNGRETPISRAA